MACPIISIDLLVINLAETRPGDGTLGKVSLRPGIAIKIYHKEGKEINNAWTGI